MSYRVGIDVGTTFTAAAIHRNGSAEIFPLSEKRVVAPTMVARDDAGRLLVGWPAASQLRDRPENVVHSFKRRVGDRTPLPLGEREYEPSWFMAQVISAVVTEITRVEGEAPNRIALTHPATWNAHKMARLLQAASTAGLAADAIVLLSEPEAAAMTHAATTDVSNESMMAVYDLGGGSFDTAALRRARDGYQIVGLPEGIERLGGLDFDAALYRYAIDQLSRSLPKIDPDDEATARSLSHLHLDCVVAKEALSFEQHAKLSLGVGGKSASITVQRQSFEALLRPALMETISALRRCLASARIEAEDLSEVLLTGGSSQIPLVTELLSTELGRPVSVHPAPKELVALGAAYAAAKEDGAEVYDPSRANSVAEAVVQPTVAWVYANGGPATNGDGRGPEVAALSRVDEAAEPTAGFSGDQTAAGTVRTQVPPTADGHGRPPSLLPALDSDQPGQGDVRSGAAESSKTPAGVGRANASQRTARPASADAHSGRDSGTVTQTAEAQTGGWFDDARVSLMIGVAGALALVVLIAVAVVLRSLLA